MLCGRFYIPSLLHTAMALYKRKHKLYDLVVNETEAVVVRIIFDKYVQEGLGAQRIATYLNKLGYRARTGKMWHHASIRGIVCNLTLYGCPAV